MNLKEREERVQIMLLQFKFKNFMSFADETILDMMATNIKEHNNTLIEKNDYKILPIAAIFGANASGKSNFFQAFRAMAFDVFKIMEKENKHYWIRPYMFDNKLASEPSEFEVSINIDEMEYRYGFVRDQEKVFEEWLFEKKFLKGTKAQEKCVFYRNDNELKKVISTNEKREIEFVNSMTNTSELLISNLGRREKSLYTNIYNWFNSTSLFTDSSSDIEEIIFTDFFAKHLFGKTEILKWIIEFIKKFDDSIKDIKIEKEKTKNLNDKYVIYSSHICSDKNEKWVPFKSESSGTQKLFSLGVLLHKGLHEGKVIFMDELDTKLHPLVFRYFVKQFRDKEINIGRGQLIFSSHNLVVLDSSDLRRDEIWFVEKNKQKSSLYSLYDFKEDENTIRSDLDFGKHYLSGRFGAIPFQDEEV